MQKFKGTPGPWESKTIHGDLKVIQKGSYEKLAPGMVSYCCVTELENKHDAKLIAAAPELLEALQKMVESYQFEASIDNPALLQARAAIAKALGK
ncbi:hypothetical protein [Leclercia adecarboxylata]|uniref:hypothetical protein n=1 Tax=Leclercia adecarboxylata TaxID=83655 RepID=UPI0021F0E76F|nr:hypothetical protein [Leclercia adecarboxylata]UYM55267.1 hypothetical protein N5937_21480 [Leclercia adecarboxylata]